MFNSSSFAYLEPSPAQKSRASAVLRVRDAAFPQFHSFTDVLADEAKAHDSPWAAD